MTLAFRIRQSWWVRPLIWVAAFNASIGIAVDVEKLSRFIVTHGMKPRFEKS